MGACLGTNSRKQYNVYLAPTFTKRFQDFHPLEVTMLELTYQDLAKRCINNILTRQVFQVFFHANGLMAELMFQKFDEENTGTISKQKFIEAFQIMVKGTFQQKASALFQFYCVEKTSGICYAQLLRILFSYQIQELNKMLFDQRFLKQLGNVMISYYFGPEMKIQEKTILEPHQEKKAVRALRKGSAYVPAPHQFRRIENRVKQILQEENKSLNKKANLPPVLKKQKLKQQLKLQPIQQFRQSSANLVDLKKQRKTGQLKSNISSLIKRYTIFLFTSLNLDKDKDLLSKQHFCSLLISHPSIFDIYLTGFHTYIWQIGNDGIPQYMNTSSLVQGFAKFVTSQNSKNVYLKLKKTTIFVFENSQSRRFYEVICLQGLNLEPINSLSGEQGLKIKHRDGLYPQKVLIFSDNKQKWFKELQSYKQNSIFEEYIKLERIGKGNFSNVYKGKEKKTDSLVAIKMIEPNKLDETQCQVLKREIGILKQCRHPNIVKFITQYRTNQHIYIITEFLSEGDLFQYTRKKSFLQQYQAAIIFKQLVQAMLYLNQQLGIIHRDLKPENVMIKMTENKQMVHRIKIIDFGFGVYKDKLDGLTQEQKYVGTPGFIAPEIYLRQDYNQKIDTFSLGIILYFMLYGHLPFQSNFFQQIRQQTITCSISLNNTHWSNISQEAKDLVYKILTFSDTRVSTKQILQHHWLNNIQQLKEHKGRNKKKLVFSGF